MKTTPLPSQSFLQECFDYNPMTGEVFWKQRPLHHFAPKHITPEHSMNRWNSRYAGRGCNTKSSNTSGYLEIRVNKQSYLLHRVIWKLVHGLDPTGIIDHKDGDPYNLRLNNLRAATNGQNKANGTVYKNNVLGIKGVGQLPSGRFQAAIRQLGKYKYLGSFDTKEEAHIAYCKAADELHGEFARYE